MHTTLTVLFLHTLAVFCQVVQFIQKHQCFFFRKIIQKGYHIFSVHLFCGRINRNFIYIFQRSLTFRIKAPDRIHLIIPQFDTPRIILCQRIDINDSSTHRKLPRKLYLTGAFIPQLYQLFLQLIQIDHTVTFKMKKSASDLFQRHQEIHTSVDAGNNGHFFLFQKCPDHTHPLPDQKISVYICLKKQKILCRIKIYIFVIESVILIDFLCVALIIRKDQMIWKKPGKSIHQMDLLGLHASGNIENSAVCATALFYFLKLCKTLQRMQKCFHTNLNS